MRRFFPIIIISILVVLAAIYLPGLSKYLRLQHREKELDQSIQHLEEQILLLKGEEHLLRTDLTKLEEVVREELGLVRPGEVVYKVVEEEVSDCDDAGEEPCSAS